MENKELICKNIFTEYKEIKNKIFLNDYRLSIKQVPSSNEEHERYFFLKKKLKNECWEYLSTREKLELDK